MLAKINEQSEKTKYLNQALQPIIAVNITINNSIPQQILLILSM